MSKSTKTQKTTPAGNEARRAARKPGRVETIKPDQAMGDPVAFASKPAEKTKTRARTQAQREATEKLQREAAERRRKLDQARVTVRPFVGPSQAAVMLGSHEFDQVWLDMADTIEQCPLTKDTENQGVRAIVQLHYFNPGSDWYITELDRDGDGLEQAFGWAVLNGDLQNAEVGYINLGELIRHGAELDLHWQRRELVSVQAERLRLATEPQGVQAATDEEEDHDWRVTLADQLRRDGASEERVAEVLAYEARVREYETSGMTRSDAQGVVDVEIEAEQQAARASVVAVGDQEPPRDLEAEEVDATLAAARETAQDETKAEALPPLSSVRVPLAMLRAALCTAASTDIRQYLNAVKLHRPADEEVRIVSTDGHRMLVQSCELEEPPTWLNGQGVLLASTELREVLPMLAKHGDQVVLEYGTGHSHVIARSADGFCQFRIYQVEGTYPDYQRILDGVDLSNTGGDALEAAHVNPEYLKGAAEIAKALGAKSVQAFAGDAQKATTFLFGDRDQTVLVVMPMRMESRVTSSTAKLIGNGLASSVGALRAHLTRNEEALKKARKAKDEGAAAKLEERVKHYQARIAELLEATGKALPAPAKA